MNYDMIHSGKRIQQLRMEKGYTQDELAATLNINRSYLSRIESGKKDVQWMSLSSSRKFSMCLWIF